MGVAPQHLGLDVLASRSPLGKKLSVRVANPTNRSLHTTLSFRTPPAGSVVVKSLAAAAPEAVHVEATETNTTWASLSQQGWTFPPYSFTTLVTATEMLWV